MKEIIVQNNYAWPALKSELIRCMQTEDMCPATTRFKVLSLKKLAFDGVEEDIELVGINTCGGYPDKKTVTHAPKMIGRCADTILLASCITRGNPIGFPCPHTIQKKSAIIKEICEEIRIIDYIH